MIKYIKGERKGIFEEERKKEDGVIRHLGVCFESIARQ